MGLSYMLVFIAGATSFLQRQASTVVESMSSAMPWAILAMMLAEAGATITRSARLASATCSTLYWKLRSKVSTMQRVLHSVSKVSGVMNWVAFLVMMTCTSQCCLASMLATLAIL